MVLSQVRERPMAMPAAEARSSDQCCARVEALLIGSGPLDRRPVRSQADMLGLRWINERDHLQKWTEDVVGDLAGSSEGLAVGRSHPVRMAEWPRVGRIDLTVACAGEGTPAFAELKCGSDQHALTACAWDVLKLSLALHRGDTECAYLLAATTTALRNQPVRGAEFFDDGEWELGTGPDTVRGLVARMAASGRSAAAPRPVPRSHQKARRGRLPRCWRQLGAAAQSRVRSGTAAALGAVHIEGTFRRQWESSAERAGLTAGLREACTRGNRNRGIANAYIRLYCNADHGSKERVTEWDAQR